MQAAYKKFGLQGDTVMSLYNQFWPIGALLGVLSLTIYAGSAVAADDPALDHENDPIESLDERHAAEIPVQWRQEDLSATADPQRWVRFKILGINDFHGQLGAGRRVGNRPVGSAPILAAYRKRSF